MESCCKCSANVSQEWEEVSSCLVEGAIPVAKYLSKRTGLTVVHADINGPIVSGYICVPIRATDDDGLPHALEHLIYLGSDKYPYAGVLDILANKCLASGTNAWTDLDHVCYTLHTTGAAGFEQLLPIYMNHVLYPLLTDDAFKTEIFHIGAHGHDGGVVFNEVAARENTSFCKATTALFKKLYPEESGYHWNVGGTMNTLRTSCTNEKVKAFHQRFFHPRNICVIVCGKVKISKILMVLHHIMMKTNWKSIENLLSQPWFTEEKDPIPDTATPVETSVQFPASSKDQGCFVTIGFLGPSIVDRDIRDVYALQLLLKYLCKSPIAPLQLDFVQNQQSFLATKLDYSFSEYGRPTLTIEFDGVEYEDRYKIKPHLITSLSKVSYHFDLDRMESIIQSEIRMEVSHLETSPHANVAESIMKDFMYGDRSEEKFETRLNKIPVYKSLLYEPLEFWVQRLLINCILKVNWVTVYAEPSRDILQSLTEEDLSRIENRKSVCGGKHLKKLLVDLDQAILKHNKPIPDKILREVKVPSMKSIQYHTIKRTKNPEWVFPTDFPSTLCLDDIQTSFVYVGVFMDTSSLDNSFRCFLPLFKTVLLNSPVLMTDVSSGNQLLTTFEQVCETREQDLQICQLNLGIEMDGFEEGMSYFECGSFSHILAFGIQMELDKVEEGMHWIRRTLWDTRWDTDRIKTELNKIFAEVQVSSQMGDRMCKSILKHLLFNEDSNVVNTSVISQMLLMEQLEREEDLKGDHERLIKDVLDAILKEIRNPNNIALHIAGNMERVRTKLEGLHCRSLGGLLKDCFPFSQKKVGERNFANTFDTKWMRPKEHFQYAERRPSIYDRNHVIFAMKYETISYFLMVAPGPSSFMDKDLPALLTAVQYFTQQEGSLFKQVRGGGYAQAFNLVPKIHEGLIYFYLHRCKDLPGAYALCSSIINEYLNSDNKHLWSTELLAAAKSSLIFECLETERTPLSLAANSCLDYYRNVPGTFIRALIPEIAKVKIRHVKKMTKKYLDVLFHSSKDNYATVVTCPAEIAEIIQHDLNVVGKPMRIINSVTEL